MSVTTVAPDRRRSASRIAATTLAPDDVPANNASSRASLRAITFAAAVAAGRISSTTDGSHSGGM